MIKSPIVKREFFLVEYSCLCRAENHSTDIGASHSKRRKPDDRRDTDQTKCLSQLKVRMPLNVRTKQIPVRNDP